MRTCSARVWESHYYPLNYRVSGGKRSYLGIVAPKFVSPELVYAVPNDASAQLLNSETMDGHIALVDRGKVPLVTKVRRAQEVSGCWCWLVQWTAEQNPQAGAVGIVIVDDGGCSQQYECGVLGSRHRGRCVPIARWLLTGRG